MNTTFSLTPLLRSTIGFDRLSDIFESISNNEEAWNNYPPYNIDKQGEDKYGITMAVAGFSEKDLNITVLSDRVTVCGRIEDRNDEGTEYIYRGIAARPFERTFRLDDHMKVVDAEINNGLLRINLVRQIPEEQKPQNIQIRSVQSTKAIEHASSNDNKNSKKVA